MLDVNSFDLSFNFSMQSDRDVTDLAEMEDTELDAPGQKLESRLIVREGFESTEILT